MNDNGRKNKDRNMIFCMKDYSVLMQNPIEFFL